MVPTFRFSDCNTVYRSNLHHLHYTLIPFYLPHCYHPNNIHRMSTSYKHPQCSACNFLQLPLNTSYLDLTYSSTHQSHTSSVRFPFSDEKSHFMPIKTRVKIILTKKSNKMQQCIKILLILILSEAQHVSGDTLSGSI